MKIYLIVSVDTECDKSDNWKVKQPLSYRNILEGIPDRLQPIFDEFHIKPTYLLSPEILKEEAPVELFKSLMNRAELGSHLHPEFIEPHANWMTDNTSFVQRDFTPQDEFEKLFNLTELFKNRFGFSPKSFRAGRYGLSQYTLSFIEKLGYEVDSSVTPYMWWRYRKGQGISFLGSPVQPYHPSSIDFRKPGNVKILEVPITLINPFWDMFPRPFLRWINPLNRLQIIILNLLFRNRLRCSWLRPTFSTVEEMLYVTKYISDKFGKDHAVICMMFHSVEATAGENPYTTTDEDVSRFLKKLREYFRIIFSEYNVTSIGLSQTATIYHPQSGK